MRKKISILFIFLGSSLSWNYSHAQEKIDLNLLTPEEIATADFQKKELYFTGPALKHPNIFARKNLNGSTLKMDLKDSGIEKAKIITGVDFTGATGAPAGFVRGKNLVGAKLSGLDLTHIGIQEAVSLLKVDFTGATNAPAGFVEGKNLTSAKLSGLDLTHIGIQKLPDYMGIDFTGATNVPPGFADGKDLSAAKLSGLNLTHIGIQGATRLYGTDFTGATDAPAGFASGKILTHAKLSGLDLTHIEIQEASDLENADFTGAINPPGGYTLDEFKALVAQSDGLQLLKNKLENEKPKKLKEKKLKLKEEELEKLREQKTSWATIVGTASHPVQDDTCLESIRKKTLQVMAAVWPSISYGKKGTILKNEKCNQFLRDAEGQYGGFKFLSRSHVKTEYTEFSKNLPTYFIELCSVEMNSHNYYDRFRKSLSDPFYGPIFASLFEKEPFKDGECKNFKVQVDHKEGHSFFIPKWDDLPKSYDQLSEGTNDQYKKIKTYTSGAYTDINHKYRVRTVKQKDHKKLTSELSTLPTYHPSGRPEVWRKADASFDNVPFEELEVGKVYTELAPTSTSQINKYFLGKKGTIRVRLPNDFNVARSIGHLSQIRGELEVLLPPGSCFMYEGVKKEIHDLKELDVHDFVLVPWLQSQDYGYYSRGLAIEEANKYYGRDYPLASDHRIVGDKRVARPNHGLTHGVRQAYLALDFIKHIAEKADQYGEMGHWARGLLKDEKKLEALFLMALHFRAGRLAETDNYFPEYVDHIKKVLSKSQIITDPQEIDRYADLFSEKPNLDSPEKKFMMTALDVSHRTDHMRMRFWDMSQSETDQKWTIGSNASQSEGNQREIIQFMQRRGKIYLEATGAYNVKEPPAQSEDVGNYTYSNSKLFGELENNPKKLYRVMEEVSKK